MPQLGFQNDFDPALPGMIYDNNDQGNDICSCINDPALAAGYQGGCPLFELTPGAEDGLGSSLVSPVGTGAFVGLAIRDRYKQPQGYGGPTGRLYGPSDVVPVLRKGKIWVPIFGDAAKKGDTMSAGSSATLGSLTNGSGTAIPVQAYQHSRMGDTMCVVEVALPLLAGAVDPPDQPGTVASATPATGAAAGGTAITLTGTHFRAGDTVKLGGVSATAVVVVSSTSITCTTGAHATGVVDIVVTHTDATTATKTGGFTYT